MAVIGRPIGVPGHTTQKLDAPTDLDSGTANSFTMKVGGVAVSPDEASLAVYVSNVRQIPGDAYTVSGSTLTFTGAVTTSNYSYAIIMGDAMYVENSSVDESKLKVSNGPTNGQFLSAQSGNTGGLTWAAVDTFDGFVLEDGDGTEVSITENKEIKFVEGTGIDINWTDTSDGSDADPYDLTFTCDLDASELAGNTLASGVTASSLTSTGTIAAFRSTGIDDNADALAMTIDSSERVGVGTASPSHTLDVTGTLRSDYITFRANNSSAPSGDATIYRQADNTMAFATNSAERMRIDSDGNVGIGTSSPSYKLDVQSPDGANNTDFFVRFYNLDQTSSQGNGVNIRAGATSGDHVFRVDNRAAGQMFLVRGDGETFTNDGTIESLSDIRIKKNVSDLSDGLELLSQLQPRTFQYNGKGQMYNDTNKTQYGFIADELMSVAPQYVSVSDGLIDGEEVNDMKSLSMIRMIPMLVKAVQELSAKVEALEAK